MRSFCTWCMPGAAQAARATFSRSEPEWTLLLKDTLPGITRVAVLRDPTSPRVGQLSVYAYLTYLQESLLEALVL